MSSSVESPASAAPSSAASNKPKCNKCDAPATKRCSRCQKVWYCSAECQRFDWKKHKPVCDSEFQMSQYELHKKAFDAVVQKYKLDTEEKSSEIAELLTAGANSVSAAEFAEKFDMEIQDAVVFLEWIKTGIKFKEQSIDTAKKAGFGQGGGGDAASKR